MQLVNQRFRDELRLLEPFLLASVSSLSWLGIGRSMVIGDRLRQQVAINPYSFLLDQISLRALVLVFLASAVLIFFRSPLQPKPSLYLELGFLALISWAHGLGFWIFFGMAVVGFENPTTLEPVIALSLATIVMAPLAIGFGRIFAKLSNDRKRNRSVSTSDLP